MANCAGIKLTSNYYLCRSVKLAKNNLSTIFDLANTSIKLNYIL